MKEFKNKQKIINNKIIKKKIKNWKIVLKKLSHVPNLSR